MTGRDTPAIVEKWRGSVPIRTEVESGKCLTARGVVRQWGQKVAGSLRILDLLQTILSLTNGTSEIDVGDGAVYCRPSRTSDTVRRPHPGVRTLWLTTVAPPGLEFGTSHPPLFIARAPASIIGPLDPKNPIRVLGARRRCWDSSRVGQTWTFRWVYREE
jgi:hypothetical protein